jgi:hypothetical protein
MDQMATALTDSIAKDGQTVPTAHLPMGGYRHTGVAVAAAQTDYLRVDQAQKNTLAYLTSVAGTANAITATAALGMTALTAGMRFSFIPASTSTNATVTLNINAIGAVTLKRTGTTALQVGDIVEDRPAEVLYDGTNFQLLNPQKITATSGAVASVNSVGPDGSGNVILLVRPTLTANLTFYVRSDGNDANDGLSNSSGGAFKTIQKAHDTCAKFDLNGYDITITVVTGTYPDPINWIGGWVGSGNVKLAGSTGTPADVNLAFTAGRNAFIVGKGSVLQISGVKITNSGATGSGIWVIEKSTIEIIGNVDFGACPNRYHLDAISGSDIIISANYQFSGNALSHFSLQNGSRYRLSTTTITAVGTPAFTSFANVGDVSNATILALTKVGSATGAYHATAGNSVINAFGAGPSSLFGNSAGSLTTGGQFL